MIKYNLEIAKEFSDTPSGRYRNQGDYTAEAFREDILVPALEKHNQVCVILDGVFGFGSSFLEETFGGLVRVHDYSEKKINEILEIISVDDDSYILEIKGYISDADQIKHRN